jgi:hypothetical protein
MRRRLVDPDIGVLKSDDRGAAEASKDRIVGKPETGLCNCKVARSWVDGSYGVCRFVRLNNKTPLEVESVNLVRNLPPQLFPSQQDPRGLHIGTRSPVELVPVGI